MNLRKFMRANLSFAFYGNPLNEYSEDDLLQATKILDPFRTYITDLDEGLLDKAFACIVVHIKFVNRYYSSLDDKFMKEKGESWSQYHKGIFELNRAIQSVTTGIETDLEKGGKIFPIKEIIFKGSKKKQEIVLKGEILNIVRDILYAFDSVYSESHKKLMKEFSDDFYHAYEEFNNQWHLLNGEETSLSKKLIKNRQEKNRITAFNKYRNETAFYIHRFLKEHTKQELEKEVAKIPDWHKNVIGDLFISCGIAHDEKTKKINKGKEKLEARIERGYIDTSHYNTVRRWIEEGEKSLK